MHVQQEIIFYSFLWKQMWPLRTIHITKFTRNIEPHLFSVNFVMNIVGLTMLSEKQCREKKQSDFFFSIYNRFKNEHLIICYNNCLQKAINT